MNHADSVYSAALTAGSILSGFVGIFLNFRIGREANYYRDGRQQHFTTSLLLVIVAGILSVTFGMVLPLCALVAPGVAVRPITILAGVLAAIVVITAYFFDELYHYHILCKPDRGWRDEIWIVVTGLLAAGGVFIGSFSVLR